MSRLQLRYPLIVEGKYDKHTLSNVVDSPVLTTGGFSLFNDFGKKALLRRLASSSKVVLLTDPDGGGKQIRRYLSSMLPPEQIIHLYIPRIEGKERRKDHRSAAGVLGVEGMEPELLRRLLSPFAAEAEEKLCRCSVTKADWYALGLSGGTGSAEKRAALAQALSLPPDLTANALLEAVCLLCTPEQYTEALRTAGIL